MGLGMRHTSIPRLRLSFGRWQWVERCAGSFFGGLVLDASLGSIPRLRLFARADIEVEGEVQLLGQGEKMSQNLPFFFVPKPTPIYIYIVILCKKCAFSASRQGVHSVDQ